MAPTALQLSHQLRQIIYYHLDNNLADNALFLAERLHGLEPRSPDAIHLLALCHQRLGQSKIAYDYSRLLAMRGAHLGCCYVFAQVCLDLDKNTEGVTALERSRPLWDGKNSLNKLAESPRKHTPDAAAVYCLLGKLFDADREIKRAVDCYVEALKLNPFMWDAFERLCNTGANIRTSNIFKATSEMLSTIYATAVPNSRGQGDDRMVPAGQLHSQAPSNRYQLHTPGIDPFTSATAMGNPMLAFGGLINPSKVNNSAKSNFSPGMETPPSQGSFDNSNNYREPSGHTAFESSLEPPNAPSRKPRLVQAVNADSNLDTSKSRAISAKSQGEPGFEDHEATETATSTLPSQHKRTISGSIPQNHSASTSNPVNAPQRRSRRLFGKPVSASIGPGVRDAPEPRKAKATGTRGRSAATSTVGRVVSGNRKPLEGTEYLSKEIRHPTNIAEIVPASHKPPLQDNTSDFETTQWLLDLLGRLGQGYWASSRFQCQDALHHLHSIPQQQRETPWVLAQIGRAQHEQGKYIDAEKTFSRLRKRVPSRMEDMEIYSTVLWHLKNDTELAFLSHELVDADRSSPQAWCTIGNSFSLQRDHDQALKCFKRATQLNPKFAYGYTLQGHEYSANEEYEKALQAYRRAISADHRHYNGWYGMAKVYEKLGKYDMAEEHYRAAASINPTNAVLVWSIGMVLEKLKKPQAALVHYKHACDLAPSSAMPRFKKARILLNLQRFQEALDEFNILKDMVPDESNVHFMLGRVHKQLGNKSDAVRHFTIALNLDPKAAPYIKETMESIDQEDEDESDDDEQMS